MLRVIHRFRFWAGLLAVVGALPAMVGHEAARAAATSNSDWPSYGRDHAEQRFSPDRQIGTGNVKQLGVAWSYNMRTGRGVEATPLVVNGVMYVTSAWSIVYALDAKTGKELWVFDPKVDHAVGAKSCCDAVNRGVAFADGRVFDAALDGRLIAIDAQTGRSLWQTQTVDASQPYVVTGAPCVAKGLVLIGNSGSDLGVRGYLSAYHANTGKLAWRFYAVPGNPALGPDHAASDNVMAMAAKTWHGKWWTQGGGGAVWDSITYDPELDRVYFGVGNGAPWNAQIRSPGGGDNLFIASIVAVDRKTGHYIWHYQETPGETWDSESTESIVQAKLRIGGKIHRVLMHAPKNGFFYVIDRDSGKLLSAQNIVPMAKTADTPKGKPISWAYGIDMKTGRPLENIEARFLNGASAVVHPVGPGAHCWQPMAYSVQTGLVYIPVQDFSGLFATNPHYKPQPPYARASGLKVAGAIPDNQELRESLPKRMAARLVAWDPVAQKEVWRVPMGFAGNGGVLTTAGNLVFESESTGNFEAFDALTGAKLWSFDAQATAQGGPISYQIDGVQYIAIAIGNGGSSWLAGGLGVPHQKNLPVGRVVVFRLNGNAPYPRINTALLPVPLPPVIAGSTPELVAHGAKVFNTYCAGCHGFGAISGDVTPDLRRSGFIQDADAFASVVTEGALLQNGMPRFGAAISNPDVESIRIFLASEAHYLYDLQNGKTATSAAHPKDYKGGVTGGQ